MMKDVKKSLKDNIVSAFAKEGIPPENRIKIMKRIEASESKNVKKKEYKEATSAGGGSGQYSAPLFSTKKGDLVDSVKKVKNFYEKSKKVETKEATSSSSSGQYSQPAIWAKSMSKKHWKGATTKYMPGSKRVQVKKKCKTFPYCNQGDIKALKIFESEIVQSAINNVSDKFGYDKSIISEIVFREIKKRQN